MSETLHRIHHEGVLCSNRARPHLRSDADLTADPLRHGTRGTPGQARLSGNFGESLLPMGPPRTGARLMLTCCDASTLTCWGLSTPLPEAQL